MKPLLVLAVVALAALPARTQNNGCITCHDTQDEQLGRSVHPMVSCADCHNGNEGAGEMADAHAGGFIGRPKPAQMAAMCGSCHQEAAKDWLRSPHFEARLKGNPAGASCTDCHAPAAELTAHGIVHSNRDDSPASRLNIPLACARCHGNAAAMAASGS
ncbi:MAG: hypothetical protein HUU15_07265, partial [Candidatus Brocadiae bacterium]|nr:hypothetical protein [Candidatus Brocadiia bacterium]